MSSATTIDDPRPADGTAAAADAHDAAQLAAHRRLVRSLVVACVVAGGWLLAQDARLAQLVVGAN